MATPKITTRNWSFKLLCPAPNVEAVQQTILNRYVECITQRKGKEVADLKAVIVESKIDYTVIPQAEIDGGLAGFYGAIRLRHRAAIHSLSFAQLRAIVQTANNLNKDNFVITEKKNVKEKKEVAPVEVKVAPAAVIALPVEIKIAPVEERKDNVIIDQTPTAGENLAALRKPMKIPDTPPSIAEVPIIADSPKPEPAVEAPKAEAKVEAKAQEPTTLRFGFGSSTPLKKSEPISIPTGKLPPRRFGFRNPTVEEK